MTQEELVRELAEGLHLGCPNQGQDCPEYGVYVHQAREIIRKVRVVVADEVMGMRLPIAPLHESDPGRRYKRICSDGLDVHRKALHVIRGDELR